MTKTRSKLALVLATVLLIGLGSSFFVVLKAPIAPPQPEYDGMGLVQWIGADPRMSVISHEDIMDYRREALTNMGSPAIRYLTWMIRNPRLCLDGHSTRFDHIRERLPGRLKAIMPSPPENRVNFMNVVVAFQLIGPGAQVAVPDLLKLWDSKGNLQYASYNGFPVALGALGDKSPTVLKALHQRFNSPNRMHRALCALAAWQLDPGDSEAAALVRAELSGIGGDGSGRYALLEIMSHLGPDAAAFSPEIKALIDRSDTSDTWKRGIAANAAWRILHSNRPAIALLEQLAAGVTGGKCSKSDSDLFCATALSLRKIPGTAEISIPHLRQLSEHSDPSAASFASAILARVEVSRPQEPKSESRAEEHR